MKKVEIYSKRNLVYRVSDDSETYIIKKFADKTTMNKELGMLKLLRNNNINVPNILNVNQDKSEIVLEDLGDLTLLRWLEQREKENCIDYHKTIIKVLIFFQEFYRITKEQLNCQMTLNYVSLQNFMIKDDVVYGIDFEFCKEGLIEADIGKFVAYVITYEPMATDWKFKFVNDFIHIFMLNFNIHSVSLVKEIEIELNKIAKKKNKDIQTYDILCRIAEEII